MIALHLVSLILFMYWWLWTTEKILDLLIDSKKTCLPKEKLRYSKNSLLKAIRKYGNKFIIIANIILLLNGA